jgi:hypothetical protein
LICFSSSSKGLELYALFSFISFNSTIPCCIHLLKSFSSSCNYFYCICNCCFSAFFVLMSFLKSWSLPFNAFMPLPNLYFFYYFSSSFSSLLSSFSFWFIYFFSSYFYLIFYILSLILPIKLILIFSFLSWFPSTLS